MPGWTGPVSAEATELQNHETNGSFTRIRLSEKPAGRRIHKLVWVYKIKRDGTCKARLCVQGCTLEGGVDYDQVFSSALRYSSARALFALAARRGCQVRSIDFVAAYLQGKFMEGEVVYCRMPPGTEKDGYIIRVDKPIYGIPQAGRRLQRQIFPWFTETMRMRQLDDSDDCIFVYDDPKGIETFTVGVYVDNLQIVHSARLDANGTAIDPSSFYAKFSARLKLDWEVVDEGPMDDLLGIQAVYNKDGSITLHQEKYIWKMIAKFLPSGASPSVQSNTLPFSKLIHERVIEALSTEGCLHPNLVKPFQERIGSLMYACGAVRCDITYPVHLLCRCLTRPTPELMEECDHIFSYLSRHAKVGLTFNSGVSTLHGFSDASWETKHSTSGYVGMWQRAAISWLSRKQQSVALSSCESEIIALSEGAKDMVYLRKLILGLDATYLSGRSDLATDNQGARDLSFNSMHHDKTKHIERRHFFVRDMVEKLELNVPFVRTHDNLADFFTKAISSAPQFFWLRAWIMNEPVKPPQPEPRARKGAAAASPS